MTGLFAKAKTLTKPVTAAKKQERQEIPVAQLQQLCEIKALMQTLEGVYKSLEGEVKEAGFAEFLTMTQNTGVRPDSFRGIDGMASASVEMRKRGTNSALNEDECKLLREHNIEPFEQEVQKQLFAINPAYAEQENLMAKVEAALSKVKDLPEDFIVQQAGVTKFVVTDEMMDKAFKNGDGEVLRIVSTMALKPKLNEEYPMAELFDNVKKIVQPEVKAKKAVLPGKKAA
jgi:hypothetical protein